MNATREEIDMTTSDFTSEARELDARTGDGFALRLFRHSATATVTVSVFDATHAQSFELVVDPGKALDAFRHPFAYAAFQGIPFATPLQAHNEESVFEAN